MKYQRVIFGLCMATIIVGLLYWILVFTKVYPVVEIVSGYTAWFWSFSVPDFWMYAISALLAFAIKTKRDAMAVVFGLLTGSTMIFLALNELTFSFHTGMIFMPLTDIGIDLTFSIYCLSVGMFFTKQFSNVVSNLFAKNREL